MRITWYGHAAFLIETSGTRLIMDPYSPACGYRAVDDTADVVAISHENQKYHSCLDHIHGDFELVNGLKIQDGVCTVRGIPFTAMEVYEDDEGIGPNAMVSFVSEGLKVSHLGDLGHALNEQQLAFLEGTNILLALAGGPPTIELPDLKRVIDQVQPAVTIPMHMGTPAVDLDLQPVEDFLALFPQEKIVRHAGTTWQIAYDALPEPGTIVVLPHIR